MFLQKTYFSFQLKYWIQNIFFIFWFRLIGILLYFSVAGAITAVINFSLGFEKKAIDLEEFDNNFLKLSFSISKFLVRNPTQQVYGNFPMAGVLYLAPAFWLSSLLRYSYLDRKFQNLATQLQRVSLSDCV